jgi:hypothetical protein
MISHANKGKSWVFYCQSTQKLLDLMLVNPSVSNSPATADRFIN